MTRAIMLDLETLSSASDAAITQIAAVVFDLDTGELGVDFDVLVKSGPGRVDRGTALWWMQQKGAAEFAARVEKEGIELGEALQLLAGFVTAQGKGVPLFAHGATFDFPVVASAAAACGLEMPWSFRDQNCCRPFYRELGRVPEVPPPAGYVKHDALSDCKMQVAQLVEARRRLGLIGRAA